MCEFIIQIHSDNDVETLTIIIIFFFLPKWTQCDWNMCQQYYIKENIQEFFYEWRRIVRSEKSGNTYKLKNVSFLFCITFYVHKHHSWLVREVASIPFHPFLFPLVNLYLVKRKLRLSYQNGMWDVFSIADHESTVSFPENLPIAWKIGKLMLISCNSVMLASFY